MSSFWPSAERERERVSIFIYGGREGGSGLCNVILLELVLLTARQKLSFIIFIISILSPDTNPSLDRTARVEHSSPQIQIYVMKT